MLAGQSQISLQICQLLDVVSSTLWEKKTFPEYLQCLSILLSVTPESIKPAEEIKGVLLFSRRR
jgi:hypothetical protein